ncbi:hypothetical protein NE237_007279 [Protea cynaroides]|uniref:CLAVATA3/ESR (CLE)-related protein 25 n=1 Tax=Protea cynaroides TaxID=273540 RepID=A0A9Q0KP54_9MAGN|nr:hypothetical protein NE237_007279 [Protea cynaroides]
MGHHGGSLRVFFKSLVLVGLIWFLLAEIQLSEGFKTTKTTTATSPAGSFKQMELMIGTDSPIVPPDLDINYMSKRRVPNGPDPIHNRRAGKSKQLPGRA